MPIFEFRCLECKEIFEVIVVAGNEDDDEMKCSHCGSQSFERVLSSGNISVAAGASAPGQGAGKQERNCSSGSCTTYTLPGQA